MVSNGRIAGPYNPITQQVSPVGSPLDVTDCEHASGSTNASDGGVPVQVGGAFLSCSGTQDIFCDTPNLGGEYKIWLIAQSSAVTSCTPTVNPDGVSLAFDQKCAKADNFKLMLPAVAHVIACKYNDTNGNGVLDPGELNISGWPITATVPTSSYVTLRSDTQAGTSITAKTDATGCVSFNASGIPNNTQVAVSLTEASKTGWTQTAPANGIFDASGNPAASGPTSISGAVSSNTGTGECGAVISVNLGPGEMVTAPKFGNTNPQCPDCSILGTVTVTNTATPNTLYTWSISKSVDKTEIDDVTPTGSATFNYNVSVTHDNGAGSLLTGSITVINGDDSNPWVTLNLSDAVTDGGVCEIKDPASGQYVSEVMNLTLNSFSETTLPYQCTYASAPSPAAGTETATARNTSNPEVQYAGTATYDFSKATAIPNDSVNVTDTLAGTLGTVSFTDSNPKTFSYPHSFTGDPAGTCTSHGNTATVTADTTGATSSASQSVKVCVSNPNPTSITATPNPTAVTLADSPVTLKDSAVLSGGTNLTGTITFTLKFNGAVVDTEPVTVNGAGTYTTPRGYTLPTTSTVVGAYQWNVKYSGDTNNAAAAENGNAAELVTVGMATPLTSINLSGTKIGSEFTSQVTATVQLSGGYSPGGTLTFTLVGYETGATTVWTQAVNGDGNYSISSYGHSSDEEEYLHVVYSGDPNNNSAQKFADIYFRR